MTRAVCYRCLVVGLVVWQTGCHEPIGPPLKEAQLEPPLQSMTMRLDTRTMVVRLQPEVKLGEVVDLRVFGPFRPGVTLQQVSRDHGEPKATRRDYAVTYYGYSHHDVKIEIAHERSMSGDAVWEQWAVCAYPITDTGVLSPSLAKLVAQERPSELIVATSGDPMISAQMAAGRVSMIRWYGVRTGDSRTQAP